MKTDTELLDALRNLCGFVENGTSDVVIISQDDATKDWCVTVGRMTAYTRSKTYYGKTLREALSTIPEVSE